MTDADAKYQLEGWMSMDVNPECETCISIRALQHALQAIEDRAALVAVEGAGMPIIPVRRRDAARRHMRGEK